MITDDIRSRAAAWVKKQVETATRIPVPEDDYEEIRVEDQTFYLVSTFEGLHDVRADGLVYPYYDPVGYPTQGYGRLLSRFKGADLSQWKPITTRQASVWLTEDIAIARDDVLDLTSTTLTANQEAALTSFVFNVGAGNYELSTMRRLINNGMMDLAANEFPRWIFAGGTILTGLRKRRLREQAVFLQN